MMIQRYDVHPVLNRFQDQMNQVLEDVIKDSQGSSSATAEWSPNVDILEYDDRFELYADMPGVGTNAIDLSLENNVLTVTGERAKLASSDEQRHVRLERPCWKIPSPICFTKCC